MLWFILLIFPHCQEQNRKDNLLSCEDDNYAICEHKSTKQCLFVCYKSIRTNVQNMWQKGKEQNLDFKNNYTTNELWYTWSHTNTRQLHQLWPHDQNTACTEAMLIISNRSLLRLLILNFKRNKKHWQRSNIKKNTIFLSTSSLLTCKGNRPSHSDRLHCPDYCYFSMISCIYTFFLSWLLLLFNDILHL